MSKPVNLNRYRKEKARAEKKARADQNAVTFGRKKSERDADEKVLNKQRRDLDNHELEE
ncbi:MULTISPECIES: DUF4169 family protein [unclassified Ruegeria]|uniref:DUF4169 family protein n=1 Tax=unclassified Ruegeria TaxID=2625375 RepID=UPI001ADC6C70|nr:MULTISPECIES: DUF4169 family protein [unclassified Ruegeria]MBO9413300.1 DUF4169 family protein [Ruegeria sp. R8_1]MBO9413964.1 DUF4169 family protein [Ruegeria sp. R8_2]